MDSMKPKFWIPESTVHWLQHVPVDRPVAVLIRHSARGPLEPGDAGYSVPLLPEGFALAGALGRIAASRVASLHSSPLLRCLQSAEALQIGAGTSLTVQPNDGLGDPGVYVTRSAEAGATWREKGHEAVMAAIVANVQLPGLRPPRQAAQELTDYMLERADAPGLHFFFTHDSLVTATAAHALGASLTKADWPQYLEAAFFWRDGERDLAAYRQLHRGISW
jgi:broad specificity phosphatase PhoE